MSAYEFTPPERTPGTQPAFSGGPPQPPPRPPKRTAQDLLDPGDPAKRIFVLDYIEIRELAALLALKPFKVVAEILELGIFKNADEWIVFQTAAAVAHRHGFVVERIFPD